MALDNSRHRYCAQGQKRNSPYPSPERQSLTVRRGPGGTQDSHSAPIRWGREALPESAVPAPVLLKVRNSDRGGCQVLLPFGGISTRCDNGNGPVRGASVRPA